MIDPIRFDAEGHGFSIPHNQCYKVAVIFRQALHRVAWQSGAGVSHASMADYFSQGIEIVALSDAVQLYSSLVAEGALNLCAIIAVGADSFYASNASKSRFQKLELVLRHAVAPDELRDSELRDRTERLANIRNALVHPKPTTLPIERDGRSMLPSALEVAADSSIQDAVQIVQLLGRVNPAWADILSIA